MSLLRRPAVPAGMPTISPTPGPDTGDKPLATATKKKHRIIDRAPTHMRPKNRKLSRPISVNAMKLLLDHAAAVHYSEGSTRWQGIDQHLLAKDGHYPTNLDCSASVTWALWNSLAARFHKSDVVNGEHWRAGYTGTMVDHGLRIPLSIPRFWMPGDAIIYGNPTEHVAMYVGYDRRYGYMVISQGSEDGPYYLRWNYRPDAYRVKRYI